MFCIFLVAFGMTVSILPQIVAYIISVGGLVAIIAISVIASREEKKEKQKFQSMNEEDCEKKWMQYFDLVNEMSRKEKYGRKQLNTDWVQIFNQIIYVISSNRYLLRRKLNDFDIASCLVYSLTWNNNTDENILFAFDCAKKVISEPKEYIRELGYGYKLELEVENIFQKVNIDIPDETITTEILISIIRTYLMQKTERGIVQLSDFLHILYLKCK